MFALRQLGIGCVLSAAWINLAFAGGFFLTLGNPSASGDPKARDAFVTVRADGCHMPSLARISGKAEGLVNGRRQSVPLKLTALSSKGVYAVRREWPADGVWVVSLSGSYLGRTTGAVIPVTPEGFQRELAKLFPRAPAEADVEAALRAAATSQVASR
ncbi:MAG: hypothetical protein AAB225_19350 [Acidobacteriota bacterium]